MRTAIRLKTAACAACAGTALLACGSAGVAPSPGQSAAIPAPASAPVRAAALADGYYTLGRNQHAAGRYDDALQSYRQALQLDAHHVKARNGMAVLYAGQGEYAKAIALWQALVREGEAASSPDSAYLRGNLGYAYLLAGDGEQAVAALEKACVLDPLDPMHWEHLAQALERQGQGERAALMRRQAQSLRTHDVQSDYALLAGDGEAPATARALAVRRQHERVLERKGGPVVASHELDGTEPRWPQAPAHTEVVAMGGALVELRRVVAQAPQPSAAVPSPLPPSPLPLPQASTSALLPRPSAFAASAWPADGNLPVRLEISNGNGVTGMAAALARTVRGDNVKVVRLTNVRPFAVPVSRVEYQSDQQAAAELLATRLGMTMAAPAGGQQRAQVRIVLGRDLLSPAVLRQRYLK